MLLLLSIKTFGKAEVLSLFLGLVFAVFILFTASIQAVAESGSRVAEVYPKSSHTFVLTENGSIWAWGNNRYGKLGDGTTTNRFLPVQPVLENVAEIYPQSSGHTFALKDDGTLWAWERNWDGRLGAGTDESAYPTPVQILDNVEEIYPHERHSFAITTDGRVWGWGHNNHGQVGDGTTRNRFEPVEVELNNVNKIIPGQNNTFALLNDNTLWAWGNNRYGKLGDGTATNRTQPVKIMDNIKNVYPRDKHTIAQRMDQTLWAWGYNWYGQLGDGSNDNQYAPVEVNIGKVENIYAQESHAYAIKEDGSVWAWGNNWYGQLGDGSISNRHKPIQIPLDNIKDLHPQEHHTFAVDEDGTLWGWGRNWNGQVTDQSSTHAQPSPLDIADGITRAYVNNDKALALNDEGALHSWGNSDNPTTIELNNVKTIYPQENHTFALKEDGSLWGWGDNSRGQLGIGTVENQENPTQILLGEDLPTYSITASAVPEESGTINGDGTYRHGESVTLEIVPESGYSFINWTENGKEIDTKKEISFLANRDRELVANLEAPEEEPEEEPVEEEPAPETYRISLSVEPEDGGTVDGKGEYEQGEKVTVTASASEGYEFVNWTEIINHEDFNDQEESTDIEAEYSDQKEYSFTAERDRELIANFEAVEEEVEKAKVTAVSAVNGEITATFDRDLETKPELDDFEAYFKSETALTGEERENDDTEEANSDQDSEANEQDESNTDTDSNENNNDTDFEILNLTSIEWNEEYPNRAQLAFDAFKPADQDISYTIKVSYLEQDPLASEPFVIEADLPSFKLGLEAKPEKGGVLHGEGEYEEGKEVVVSAEAGEEYSFSKWTLGSDTISEQADFTYTMPAQDTELVAHFEEKPETYVISLSKDPEEGGTVQGEGSYEAGDEVTVTAEANEGYRFVSWSEIISASENEDTVLDPEDESQVDDHNNPISDEEDETSEENRESETLEQETIVVSEENKYSFTIENDRDLVAGFEVYEEEIESAAINPQKVEFDLNQPEPVKTEITWNDASQVDSVSGDGIENENYSLEDNILSVEQEFLKNFSEGETLELVIGFDTGDETSLMVTVTDSTDHSGFALNLPEEVRENEAFVLEFKAARNSKKEALNDEKAVTVNSSLSGELFDDTLHFENGEAALEFSLEEAGEHELTIEVEAVTESKTFTLDVVPEKEPLQTVELTALEGSGAVKAVYANEEIILDRESKAFKVEAGTEVSFSAAAGDGWEFDSWGGNFAENPGEFIHTIETDYKVEAVFAKLPEKHSLTLIPDPEAGGILQGEGQYEEGEEVAVSAEANEGYSFSKWAIGDDKISEQTEFTHTMPAEDIMLTAVFEEKPETYDISLSADPDDGGTVRGEGSYEEGEKVELEADPEDEYEFAEWTDEDEVLSEEKKITLEPTEDKDLIANFIESEEEEAGDESSGVYFVDIATDEEEKGSVIGGGVYEKGDEAVVIAEPESGYKLYSWKEDDENVSFSEEYSFTVNSDRELTAIFEGREEARTFYITLNGHPEDGGSIQGEGVYPEDEIAVVKAEPDEGYRFDRWSENDKTVSEDAEYSFSVDSDRELTAHFVEYTGEDNIDNNNAEVSSLEKVETSQVGGDDLELPEIEANESKDAVKHEVSLNVEPEGSGTVSGSGEYIEGGLVGLNAYPEGGYYFTGWIDDEGKRISMARNYAFIIKADRNLTATFDKADNSRGERGEKRRISIASSPIDGGRVYGSGKYFEGEKITIAALPNMDFDFVNWTVNDKEVSDDIILTFRVERDLNLVANFDSIGNEDENNETSFNENPAYYQFLENYLAGNLLPEQYQKEGRSDSLTTHAINSLPPMGGTGKE